MIGSKYHGVHNAIGKRFNIPFEGSIFLSNIFLTRNLRQESRGFGFLWVDSHEHMGRRVRYTISMRFNIQWEEVNIPLLDSLPNTRGSLIWHG